MEEIDPFGDFLHTVEVEAVPAVAPSNHPTQGHIAIASEYDRNAPVHKGFGVDTHRIEADEFTIERGDVVAPQRPHRRDVLRGARRAPLEWDAECVELLARPADADAEREPAAGKVVQRSRLL